MSMKYYSPLIPLDSVDSIPSRRSCVRAKLSLLSLLSNYSVGVFTKTGSILGSKATCVVESDCLLDLHDSAVYMCLFAASFL